MTAPEQPQLPQRRGGRLSALLSTVALDVGALRESRPFRRVTAGQLVSLVGRQITVVAVPYQMYVMTHSPVLVGLLGLCQVVPLIAVSLVGGGIADRVDRRLLLLSTQAMLAVCSAALLVGALVHLGPAFLFVIVGLIGAVSALDQPTRTAILPSLVSQARLAGALSINIAIFQASLVAGPAVGGLVIVRLGLAGAYLVDVTTFTVALTVIWLLPPLPPNSAATERPIAALRRGMSFIMKQPVIVGGYAMDLMAMIFGLPRALFPILAATTFTTNAQGLGYLYAAPGLGAVLAAVCSGWLSRSTRLGRVVVVSIAIWGAAILAFGFVSALWLALLLLALAGAADACSAVCRNTIMQTLTPNELRGRLTVIYFMVVVGGPFIGDLESGVVAGATSAKLAVVSGGVLCLVGLVVAAALFPQVWRYRGRTSDVAPALTDDALAGPAV